MAYFTKRPELFAAWGIAWQVGGHIKIKPVRCKKPQCRRCPHAFYAYHVEGTGSRHHEVYLGASTAQGAPRPAYGQAGRPRKPLPEHLRATY